MGVYSGPGVVNSGLVFNHDMSNTQKSWRGAPTTNLIPNPTINAYPTINNGWGTYNTNQYNNNTYFSIGSIASVSSNVITTSGNHPLRSYDVVTPQTTGGGVTAGINYLVKKLSDTSFTLHPYNGSQDGSQGYITSTGTFFVYNDFVNDVRVSVNSSSFPTMWWGPPHLPNSGLVKEIRTRGFTNPQTGEITDCVRLHYIRTDGVKDGMSYGVDTSMTPGSPHTVSFYYRAVTPAGSGQVIQYQVYNYTGGSAAGYSQNFTLSNDWQRFTFTYTPQYNNSISYWFHAAGSGTFSWEWSCMQTELGSFATPFVAGTRSNTQALLDLTGQNTLTANSLTYNSDGTFTFSGASNYASITNSALMRPASELTIEYLIKGPTPSSWTPIIGYGNGDYTNGNYLCWVESGGALNALCRINNSGVTEYRQYSGQVVSNSVYKHMTFTMKIGSTMRSYYNGIDTNSAVSLPAGGSFSYSGTSSPYQIGGFGGAWMNATVPFLRFYNRALTADEVFQNFSAIRSLYGL